MDNLIGTNGNDVVLATVNGEDSTLELDDAFNALLGQDTLRLDVVSGTQASTDFNFDSAAYHMVGFERVLVQGRAVEIDAKLDLADMSGVDLEVRNLVNGTTDDDASLEAENVDGDVLVTNFDGNYITLDAIGGDIAMNSIVVDGDIIVGASAIVTNNVPVPGSVGGSLSMQDTVVGDDIFIYDVAGNVSFNNVSTSNGDGDVLIDGVAGSVTIINSELNDDTNINYASTVTSTTLTLEDSVIDELYVKGDSIKNLTLNLDAVSDGDSNAYFAFDTSSEDALSSLESVVVNVTGESRVFLDFNESDHINFTSLTINAQADFTGGIDFGETENGDDVTTQFILNGPGNIDINGLSEDDVLNVVYTGSGTLNLEDWEPVDGSFNASTATGNVTVELDLSEEVGLDFSYVGSKGSDRVIIDTTDGGGTLGYAATNDETIALSLAGGAGTDTLVIQEENDLSEEAMAAVSGFEVLELTDLDDEEEFDLTETHEFTSLVLSDSDADNNDLYIVGMSSSQAEDITIMLDGYDEGDEKVMFDILDLTLEDSRGLNDVVDINVIVDGSTVGETASGWNLDGNVDTDGTFELVSTTLVLDDIEALNLTTSGDVFMRNNLDVYNTTRTVVEINDIDANEMETLNITGSVSLAIDEIDANDLTVIDARTFAGAALALGKREVDLNDDGDTADLNEAATFVDTEDDIVVHGSLTSAHTLLIDGNEDVTITTGSGIDYIGVIAVDNIVINSGAGNDVIWADSEEGDVEINSGDNNDTIFVRDANDATITLGNGNDSFDYNYDSIYGDLVIDAGNGDDNININLWSDNNIDSVTVTLGAGADELYLGSTRFDALNDVVVTVTDFAVATDVVYLDEDAEGSSWTDAEAVDGLYEADYVTVSIQDGDYDVTDGVTADDIGIIEFTFEADNNDVVLDITSTGTDLLEALGDDGDEAAIRVDGDQEGYIIAYNNGNAYLFNFSADLDAAPTAVRGAITQGGTALNDASVSVSNYVQSHDENNTNESFTVTLSGGQEGFKAGDTITFENLLENFSDYVYTVATDMTATQLATQLDTIISAMGSSLYGVTASGAVLSFVSESDTGHTDVTVSYNNFAQETTYESFVVTLDEDGVNNSGEGFDIGDTFTFTNFLDGDVTYTYTVQENLTADEVGELLASVINGLANSQYDASYNTATNELMITAEAMGAETDVVVSYVDADESSVLDAGEIELIGVLENVAVGSLSTSNIGFYDWGFNPN